jgi:moderate conductance mechanosensitive channel
MRTPSPTPFQPDESAFEMTALLSLYAELPLFLKLGIIVLIAVVIHAFLRAMKRLSQWFLTRSTTQGTNNKMYFARHYPRFATLTSLIVSSLAFVTYFAAIGFILSEFDVNVTTYLASASVIGLAVAFGSQGMVQDVVIGLTLLFSDALHVGDMVEISGQIGRVERVGLRFTELINFNGQTVLIPNRNIGVVSRYRGGVVRAYADVQLPANGSPSEVRATIEKIALGVRNQYSSIIMSDPKLLNGQAVEPGGWQFLRVRFRLWPGQGAVIENTFRHRVVIALKEIDPNYADWMVTVIYRMV